MGRRAAGGAKSACRFQSFAIAADTECYAHGQAGRLACKRQGRPDLAPETTLKLDLLQVRIRGETSCLVARVDKLFIDNDIELTRLPRSNVDRPVAAGLDSSLHTEGFRFIVSSRAVMYDDSHDGVLAGGDLVEEQENSLPARHEKFQLSIQVAVVGHQCLMLTHDCCLMLIREATDR